MTALIAINNLYYRPGTLSLQDPDILRGISLTIHQGEFIAIIGENGSGKTTLIKHINGILLPSKGQVFVDGYDSSSPDSRRVIRQLVGMVFQNPEEQIVASTVEEDIAFGLENLNLPTEEIIKRVNNQLTLAELESDAKRPPHLLSGGQIQRLALAGVLARRPKVILLDEPTSMLDSRTREAFLGQVLDLHREGMTIIYVTHHMEEAALADRVLVMNQGKVIKSGTPREIFLSYGDHHKMRIERPEAVKLSEDLRSIGLEISSEVLTLEQLIAELPRYESSQISLKLDTTKGSPTITGESLISITNLHYTYLADSDLAKKALNGVDMEVFKGGIHAVAGANGSGKSTLLQHINGILKPSHGKIMVGSLDLTDPSTTLLEVIKKVGLVFQTPESQFFEVFVGDEIAYGPKQLKMEDIKERVHRAMAMVGLDFDAYKDRRLQTLSGGEKRKVAIASTLVLDQEILLFDEPIAGMDPQARDKLLSLINKLHENGKTIIITSHRLEELARMTKTVSLIVQGRVIISGTTSSVLGDAEKIQKAKLKPPVITQVAHEFIKKGWPIDREDTTTAKNLIAALKKVIS